MKINNFLKSAVLTLSLLLGSAGVRTTHSNLDPQDTSRSLEDKLRFRTRPLAEEITHEQSKKFWKDTKRFQDYIDEMVEDLDDAKRDLVICDEDSKDYKLAEFDNVRISNDIKFMEHIMKKENIPILERLIREKYDMYREITMNGNIKFEVPLVHFNNRGYIIRRAKELFKRDLEPLLYSKLSKKPKTYPKIKRCNHDERLFGLHYITNKNEIHLELLRGLYTPHAIAGALAHEFAHDLFRENVKYPSFVLNEGFADSTDRIVTLELKKRGKSEYAPALLRQELSLQINTYISLCKQYDVEPAKWISKGVESGQIILLGEGINLQAIGSVILEMEEKEHGQRIYSSILNNNLSFLPVELETYTPTND